MYVKTLRLSNFRNYKSLTLSLTSGINLIHGRNGQGKTNLVEAINFFATLSSHRVASLTPLIRSGETTANMAIELAFGSRELSLDFEINDKAANRALLNKAPCKPKDILGQLSCVIFSPEDLDIVKRDPSNRRDFLDQLIIQLTPRMQGVISDYDRVLRQRNSLLKSARASNFAAGARSTLAAWDKSLIELGSELIAARVRLTARLVPELERNYSLIASEGGAPTAYIRSSILGSLINDGEESDDSEYLETPDREEIAKLFSEKLERLRDREFERAITLVGPHRDDLVLKLGPLGVKGFASHGESWSYALALRLASLEILRRESKLGDPVLILDDVFAELDTDRRSKLAELVEHNEQVIITAAVLEDVPSQLRANRIQIVSGEIVE